jgi:hypothetical protein
MTSEDKLFAFGAALVATILILVGLALFKSCEGNRSARIECIKAGKPPPECRDAFPP